MLGLRQQRDRLLIDGEGILRRRRRRREEGGGGGGLDEFQHFRKTFQGMETFSSSSSASAGAAEQGVVIEEVDDDDDHVQGAGIGIGRKNNEEESSQKECRICRGGDEDGTRPLFYPCACTGSIRYTHEDCLSEWLQVTSNKHCDLCGKEFRFRTELRENAPRELGRLEVIFGVLQLWTEDLPPLHRMLFSLFLWLVVLPVCDATVVRLFYSKDLESAFYAVFYYSSISDFWMKWLVGVGVSFLLFASPIFFLAIREILANEVGIVINDNGEIIPNNDPGILPVADDEANHNDDDDDDNNNNNNNNNAGGIQENPQNRRTLFGRIMRFLFFGPLEDERPIIADIPFTTILGLRGDPMIAIRSIFGLFVHNVAWLVLLQLLPFMLGRFFAHFAGEFLKPYFVYLAWAYSFGYVNGGVSFKDLNWANPYSLENNTTSSSGVVLEKDLAGEMNNSTNHSSSSFFGSELLLTAFGYDVVFGFIVMYFAIRKLFASITMPLILFHIILIVADYVLLPIFTGYLVSVSLFDPKHHIASDPGSVVTTTSSFALKFFKGYEENVFAHLLIAWFVGFCFTLAMHFVIKSYSHYFRLPFHPDIMLPKSPDTIAQRISSSSNPSVINFLKEQGYLLFKMCFILCQVLLFLRLPWISLRALLFSEDSSPRIRVTTPNPSEFFLPFDFFLVHLLLPWLVEEFPLVEYTNKFITLFPRYLCVHVFDAAGYFMKAPNLSILSREIDLWIQLYVLRSAANKSSSVICTKIAAIANDQYTLRSRVNLTVLIVEVVPISDQIIEFLILDQSDSIMSLRLSRKLSSLSLKGHSLMPPFVYEQYQPFRERIQPWLTKTGNQDMSDILNHPSTTSSQTMTCIASALAITVQKKPEVLTDFLNLFDHDETMDGVFEKESTLTTSPHVVRFLLQELLMTGASHRVIPVTLNNVRISSRCGRSLEFDENSSFVLYPVVDHAEEITSLFRYYSDRLSKAATSTDDAEKQIRYARFIPSSFNFLRNLLFVISVLFLCAPATTLSFTLLPLLLGGVGLPFGFGEGLDVHHWIVGMVFLLVGIPNLHKLSWRLCFVVLSLGSVFGFMIPYLAGIWIEYVFIFPFRVPLNMCPALSHSHDLVLGFLLLKVAVGIVHVLNPGERRPFQRLMQVIRRNEQAQFQVNDIESLHVLDILLHVALPILVLILFALAIPHLFSELLIHSLETKYGELDIENEEFVKRFVPIILLGCLLCLFILKLLSHAFRLLHDKVYEKKFVIGRRLQNVDTTIASD